MTEEAQRTPEAQPNHHRRQTASSELSERPDQAVPHSARHPQEGSASTRVTVIGGAVHISDLDWEDRMMFDNAHSVLQHSADLLGSPGVTLRECRFAATELMRSLRNLLDVVEI